MQECTTLKQMTMPETGNSPFPVSRRRRFAMVCLGAWFSKLSVHLVFTINMVQSRYAHNSRHPGCVVSGTKDQSSSGEALGEGIGPSERGSRTSPAEVEKGAAHHPTSRSVEVAGKA